MKANFEASRDENLRFRTKSRKMTKKIANERTPLLENSGQHLNHLINKNIYI